MKGKLMRITNTTPLCVLISSFLHTSGGCSGGEEGRRKEVSDSHSEETGILSLFFTSGDNVTDTLNTTDKEMTIGSDDTHAIKFDLPPEMSIPVKEIPGLISITFYETTGEVMEYTFTIDGPELNNQLLDPLSQANRDIQGTDVEYYDVYYSDVDGAFDPQGSYLTIAGSFGAKLPAGGGLNLAEISLNYDNSNVEYGSFLASFVGLGDNYIPGSEVNAMDGDLTTCTTMGNTVDSPDQRLRITLGFKSSLVTK